jgi:hypothetical protein
LGVIDQANQWPLCGHLRQQAQHGQPHHESVRRVSGRQSEGQPQQGASLLAALTDAAYGTPPVPTGRRRSWRAEVEWWVIALWRLYGLHPWLVKTPTTAAPIGQNALAWTEALLRPLARARLSGGDLLAAATFVSSAVRDLARIDSELDPAAAAAYGRVLAERLDPKQFPSWPS